MATLKETVVHAPTIVLWQFLRVLFSLLPIRKKTILLEGNKSYDDNARGIYENLILRKLNLDYQITWFVEDPAKFSYLSKKENVNVSEYRSWRMGLRGVSSLVSFIYNNCTAEYCLYSNCSLGLRLFKGQHRVYLTHGIALKNLNGALTRLDGLEMIVSPSDFTSGLINKAMPGAEKITKVLGLPRNDMLFRKDANSIRFLSQFGECKKIIWMPTFKRNVTNIGSRQRNDFSQDTAKDVSLLTEEFMGRLNKELADMNILLCVKFHPFQNLDYIDFYNLSNIVSLSREDIEDNRICLYSFIAEFDAMISDYSSVVYDYLLLDKPLAFDLTDYASYAEGRGFSVEDPIEYMPGKKIRSEDDFIAFVRDVAEGVDNYQSDRERTSRLFNAYFDNQSAQRVLDSLGIV